MTVLPTSVVGSASDLMHIRIGTAGSDSAI